MENGTKLTLIEIATHRVRRGRMRPTGHARIAVGKGLVKDLPRTSQKRQVTLLSRESWLDACRELGYRIPFLGWKIPWLRRRIPWTTRRANLFVAGKRFGPEDVGSIISFGDVRLLITKELEPCVRMDEQVPGLQAVLRKAWRGGVCATVLEGGDIVISMTGVLRPATESEKAAA